MNNEEGEVNRERGVMGREQGVMNREQLTVNREFGSRILYCDSGCVVVNKIAGEALEGASGKMVDLPRLLAAELTGPSWPQPAPSEDGLAMPTAVHRLDVPVSGCAIFARTGTALRFLNEAFRAHAVKKYYWAIVEQPQNSFALDTAESAEFTHWIQFDSRKNKSIAHTEPGPGRKKAILRCHLTGRGKNYLFLEIELITGRHHQIRAQFEQMGLHIKGDLKYGAKRSEQNGGIRLHAYSVVFPYPIGSGDYITIQADPPVNDNLWQAFASENLTKGLSSPAHLSPPQETGDTG